MRVMVTGGRDFKDRKLVWDALDEHGCTHLVVGCCKTGADRFARLWADENQIDSTLYRARWRTEGRTAGPRRNTRMVDGGEADLVLSFPGGRGTSDCTRKAIAKGLQVLSWLPGFGQWVQAEDVTLPLPATKDEHGS